MKDKGIKAFLVLLLLLLIASCTMPSSKSSIVDATPREKELTLMVYMAADNDLESYAIQNLKALEHTKAEDINILVLLDRTQGYDQTNGNWTDTRLFEVLYDETSGNYIKSKRLNCPILGLSDTVDTELDMANPAVLRNFITFAKTDYKAQEYALIIWGHGTGWRGSFLENSNDNIYRAVAIDDTTGSYMTVRELEGAVNDMDLCVIGFDTCFGGVIENVYQLKTAADYTVASPGISPATGWDYKKLLTTLSGSDFTAEKIAMSMAGSSSVTTSIYENSKLSQVMEKFEIFSRYLSQTINDSDSRDYLMEKLTNVDSYSYSQYPCDMYLDIYSMAEDWQFSLVTGLSEAAEQLMSVLDQAVITQGNLHGCLGVLFMPKTSSQVFSSTHSIDYIKDSNNVLQCAFIKESQWWVPTIGGNSGSLLDKLFYTSF